EVHREELDYRRQHGEQPRVEEYEGDFPGDGEIVRSAFGSDHPEGAAKLGGGEPEPSKFPVIPGYEILEKLGRGGMGVVYKARQTSLKRLGALKMVRTAHRATPAELSRLKAEAEAVARLQHPNIVHIYEVGEHDGRPFFSMEYVEGGTLHASLRKQLPHPEEAAKQIETLAQAMHVAHGRDVIH